MTDTQKTCINCEPKFLPSRYQAVKHCCSNKCDRERVGLILHNRALETYMQDPKFCVNCQKIIPMQKKQNRFCSKSCSASYNNTLRSCSPQTKAKISHTMKANISTGKISKPVPPVKQKNQWPFTKLYGCHKCNYCSKLFWRLQPWSKCCSISCRDMICSQNKCKKTTIEFYNPFENKVVKLQSSWELSIAEYLTAQNVSWSRPTKRLKWYDKTICKHRTYLPDFWLDKYEIYVDVKNEHKQEVDKDKLAQLCELFPLVIGNITHIKSFVECQTGFEPAFSSIT